MDVTPLQCLHLSIGFILVTVTLAFALIRIWEEEAHDTAAADREVMKVQQHPVSLQRKEGVWIQRGTLMALMTG